MYFQQIGMKILAEPLVHLKWFVFCTKVPMDDIKMQFITWSPLHRMQLKQAEHLRKVSLEVQRAGLWWGLQGGSTTLP